MIVFQNYKILFLAEPLIKSFKLDKPRKITSRRNNPYSNLIIEELL
jgi:hypothetical protein